MANLSFLGRGWPHRSGHWTVWTTSSSGLITAGAGTRFVRFGGRAVDGQRCDVVVQRFVRSAPFVIAFVLHAINTYTWAELVLLGSGLTCARMLAAR